jgi:UDP-GlcNAc3NAcA epimerase
MKIVTIIGARPQIIKAAAVSRAIREFFPGRITEVIVHTGQHYDENMSQVFFDELGIPAPDVNLNVGSMSHGAQTARMIDGIEKVLKDETPNAIVLYGDTNSTLAGAVAASKIHIPVVHVEAGLRSYNKAMPEEVNRIMCDHVSTLLFSPTRTGYDNLIREGFRESKPPFSADNPGIFHCGDVMLDNSLHFAGIAGTTILNELGVEPGKFVLCTIHRDNNTDQEDRLRAIFRSLLTIANQFPVVLPLHPRTAKLLEGKLGESLHRQVEDHPGIHIIPPASFLNMIALEKSCYAVITDSGGVQKEAFFFRKPCIILRPQTEWVELVNAGVAFLADAEEDRIMTAWHKIPEVDVASVPGFYGDGQAARFILETMLEHL